jgi:uracil-DNA glycosylase
MLSLVNLAEKPAACSSCEYRSIGFGFVPDHVPENPKVAFLLEAPGADESLQRKPTVGAAGYTLQRMVEEVGWNYWQDVLIANVLHCRPPDNNYPVGSLKILAQNNCRQYHNYGNLTLTPGGLNGFKPTHFLFTIHPSFLLRQWTYTRLMKNRCFANFGDLTKAKRLTEQGHKLVVVFGDKAKNFLFPNSYSGGILKWRGHHDTFLS